MPLPDSDDKYYVFHLRSNLSENQSYVYSDKLLYSIVDMGHPAFVNGWVKDKNTELLSDTLESGSLTSYRHGNGRDWWILVHEHDSNRFHRFLFSPNGIELVGNQEIGNPIPSGLGQSVFTPDGNKFIKNNCVNIYDEDKRVDIYDFDRCTGLLSNPQDFIYGDSSVTCGIAISPNSQYLYATLSLYTYQFDLQATDILASKDTVAIFDGFQPFPGFITPFSFAQLAPDGKIYISTNFTVNYLHVIHNPDEAGEACNFEQHGITLPTCNYLGVFW